MHLRYLFQSNPGLHFLRIPVPSEHLSVHPMLLLLPYTVHLSHQFFPAHKLHQSMLLPHLLLPDHPFHLLSKQLLLFQLSLLFSYHPQTWLLP